MKRSLSILDELLKEPTYVVTLALSTLVAFIWYLSASNAEVRLYALIGGVPSIAFLLVGYVYSIRVRSENVTLRRIAKDFFEINQIYRHALSERFLLSPETDSARILDREAVALRAVLQRIENIFSRVTLRPCTVTLKLVVPLGDRLLARTYLRSEDLSIRDFEGYSDYEIGTGKNTELDNSLLPNEESKPHHYFSPNLRLDSGFACERNSYMNFYRSILVVPIHSATNVHTALVYRKELVGFLSVDTMSVHRLNNGYHLYMLAALANQMFSFMSVVRGKHTDAATASISSAT